MNNLIPVLKSWWMSGCATNVNHWNGNEIKHSIAYLFFGLKTKQINQIYSLFNSVWSQLFVNPFQPSAHWTRINSDNK
jgi:hypothetical protein